MAASSTSRPTTHTRQTQTTRINGQRVRLVTTNGKVTVKPAGEEEWVIQSEIIRRLRAMPEFVTKAEDASAGRFTLAGDFNAARRSMKESAKAKATGLTPGEHDIRLYMWPAASTTGGEIGLIEVKGADTPVSKDQRGRHALLAALGFTKQAIVKSGSPDEAADMAVALVRRWLVGNENALGGKPS